MSDDLASRMLSALADDNETSEVVNAPSLDEQKRYLERNIDCLDLEGRKAVGLVLVENGRADSLRPCAVGTVINLATLPAHIISEMHAVAVARRGRDPVSL